MTASEHAGIVADEAAIEKRYNDALAERAGSNQNLVNRLTMNTWTTSTKVGLPTEGEIFGRVALRAPNELLDGARDFYIGTEKHDGGHFRVFNWVAPIACTYYRKVDSHHELCDDVSGVRVIAHQGGRIVDYEDEAVGEHSVADLFPKRQLQVPRAPSRITGPAVADAPIRVDDDLSAEIDSTEHIRSSAPVVISPSLVGQKALPFIAGPRQVPGPALRAPDLLGRQLAAPKTVAMSAVLATLQSDQYEAITKPASESQVLQGHPGTGKTIIAAHRAAYMLNADSPPQARPHSHVLILGPTNEYVEHVQGVLRALIADAGSYEVKAIPTLLEDLAGLPYSAVPTESVVWEDVSVELAGLVDVAYSRAKEHLDDAGEKPTSADVYAELIWLLQDPPTDGLEGEWVRYLRQLPPTFAELKKRKISSYRGLMAYIGARTTRMPNPGHVIVDEAQDIHPIEWEVLGRLGNRGGWTILGDLNQRRTDHTFNSWNDVAELLAIEDDGGGAPIQILDRGYRSTAQIIRFANQLLPARDRGLYSLQQNGELPTVRKSVSAQKIHEMALESAEALLARVGSGTVAMITVNPSEVRTLMTRNGWRAEIGNPFVWRKSGLLLRLLPPERARGLEFDGVVVVEPTSFPENVGRLGVLYTALTRANRFLTVVHFQPLPRGLKARP